MRTNGDRLDPDTLLDVGAGRVVRVLVRENGLAAEGVDEGGPAWGGRMSDRATETGEMWRHGRVPVPEAPQTIRQNWIPFLTFFFLRIIFCVEHDD